MLPTSCPFGLHPNVEMFVWGGLIPGLLGEQLSASWDIHFAILVLGNFPNGFSIKKLRTKKQMLQINQRKSKDKVFHNKRP